MCGSIWCGAHVMPFEAHPCYGILRSFARCGGFTSPMEGAMKKLMLHLDDLAVESFAANEVLAMEQRLGEAQSPDRRAPTDGPLCSFQTFRPCCGVE